MGQASINMTFGSNRGLTNRFLALILFRFCPRVASVSRYSHLFENIEADRDAMAKIEAAVRAA